MRVGKAFRTDERPNSCDKVERSSGAPGTPGGVQAISDVDQSAGFARST